MSLTPAQVIATKKEFQENFRLSGLTLTQIADALHTTSTVITATMQLNTPHLEDPWVLKNFLEAYANKQHRPSVPFSALKGDYHNYWFLDTQRIQQQKIG